MHRLPVAAPYRAGECCPSDRSGRDLGVDLRDRKWSSRYATHHQPVGCALAASACCGDGCIWPSRARNKTDFTAAGTFHLHAGMFVFREKLFAAGTGQENGHMSLPGKRILRGVIELTLNVTHSRYTHSLHAATVAAMRKRAKPDIRERFGYAVKVRREELRLTQEDLAEKAHIHRTYLSDVERGSRNVSLINIEQIAEGLELQLSELFRIVEHS